MLRNYEQLVVVDQRTSSNFKERQLMSCFNVLGEAIHKAAGLVEFATRETSRSLRGQNRATINERVDWALQYEWVQRGKHPMLDQQAKAIYDDKSFRGIYQTYVLPLQTIVKSNEECDDDGDCNIADDDTDSQYSSKSHLSLEDKQKMYKHVICANIDQLWKSGRKPLRYFYKDPNQVWA